MKLKLMTFLGIILFTGSQHLAQAALSVERSRVIFNEGEKSVGLSVKNNNTQDPGNDSNLMIVFYVQIMPDDLVMQLHRF